jgi:hypothetical protein
VLRIPSFNGRWERGRRKMRGGNLAKPGEYSVSGRKEGLPGHKLLFRELKKGKNCKLSTGFNNLKVETDFSKSYLYEVMGTKVRLHHIEVK